MMPGSCMVGTATDYRRLCEAADAAATGTGDGSEALAFTGLPYKKEEIK